MDIRVVDSKLVRKDKLSRRTRIYVWPKGETILENLANRRSRPYREYKKAVVAYLLQQGYEEPILEWSQYAGCECGCSPGFIVKPQAGGMGRDFSIERYDLHVDVEMS